MKQRKYISAGDRVEHLKTGIHGIITDHVLVGDVSGYWVDLDTPWYRSSPHSAMSRILVTRSALRCVSL